MNKNSYMKEKNYLFLNKIIKMYDSIDVYGFFLMKC
ncbi:hypothetical protein CLU99_4011 [Flavobacterium sp. 2]|nr:hypothetical protein CLU99_4011 [Flavobacterium sp. 2]